MALMRMTFFFVQAQGFGHSTGWSETHYSVNAGTLQDALLQANTLANLRVQMLGAGPTLTYIRVSDDLVQGDSRITPGLPPQTFQGNPYYNQQFKSSVADFSYSSLLLRGQGSSDLTRKSFWLSGNPDLVQEIDFFQPQQAPQGGADWLLAYNAWKAQIVSGPYGFKVLDRTNANPLIPITAMGAGGVPPSPIFTTGVPHNFNQNAMVKLYKFLPKGAGSPNGTWQVNVIDPLNFKLNGFTNVGYVPTRLGFARQLRYIIVPYTSVIVRRFGSHKRGRPFDQQRGRARPRARS